MYLAATVLCFIVLSFGRLGLYSRILAGVKLPVADKVPSLHCSALVGWPLHFSSGFGSFKNINWSHLNTQPGWLVERRVTKTCV